MVQRAYTTGDIRLLFLAELSETYDCNEINEFLYILFNEYMGWDKARFHLELQTILPGPSASQFLEALSKLSSGTPVQYITGKADFNGLTFFVNPHVLIPRPETSELAEIIRQELSMRELPDYRILDIGTGSGCIAVYLKKKLPMLQVYALDDLEESLETARRNSGIHGTAIHFIKQDILGKDCKTYLPFVHLIVSNPPYVTMKERKSLRKNVREHEPSSALFVPDDDPLIYYKAIADHSLGILLDPGILYLEINESLSAEVTVLLKSKGFSRAIVKQDFFGKDRFIRAELRT
jgi:release factor glutamine methyltransferase